VVSLAVMAIKFRRKKKEGNFVLLSIRYIVLLQYSR
jgi:hypothetical protein